MRSCLNRAALGVKAPHGHTGKLIIWDNLRVITPFDYIITRRLLLMQRLYALTRDSSMGVAALDVHFASPLFTPTISTSSSPLGSLELLVL
jgi:hypothetical protein